MPFSFTNASRKSWISSTSKRADAVRLRLQVVGEERPAAQIDDDVDQRLVERHRRLAEAADAFLAAERLRNAWPSVRPTSSTVWWSSTSMSPVARIAEIEEAVAGEELEHVIQERDAGLDVVATAAVDVRG
jgi:hypothetical protein